MLSSSAKKENLMLQYTYKRKLSYSVFVFRTGYRKLQNKKCNFLTSTFQLNTLGHTDKHNLILE